MSHLIAEMDNLPHVRPPTPQALLHRAPDKPDDAEISLTKPKKYIILILAPTSVAGKVQIATSVSKSLSCPLFQGDSLHESSAKAAVVGASRSEDGGRGRYRRMWLSKMTRTGLLFPEESRPANEGFSGFGGGSASTSTSRRGSGSSIASTTSVGAASTAGSTASSAVDVGNTSLPSGGIFGTSTSQYINHPVLTISGEERRRKSNPALMVLTHPELEAWHKDAIRDAIGEYGIGIIFVPLFKSNAEYNDEMERIDNDKLPVLRPLDPRTTSQFTSFDALRATIEVVDNGNQSSYGKGKEGNLEEEMVLKIDVGGSVEEIIEEVVRGVEDIMCA
ncbi:hypothetical protein MMC09_006335 [Bachmanniomyces sp. S44760]|nr:hypothetical protein [Bachmanniomyces sp. S44760]